MTEELERRMRQVKRLNVANRELKRAIATLRRALEFYADQGSHADEVDETGATLAGTAPVVADRGAVAIKALGATRKWAKTRG